MMNSLGSTVESFSHLPTSSHNMFTVSSRKSLRQTISVHFAAIDVYPLLHGACCSQGWDSAMVNPRRLPRICGIRIPLGVARHMALEKRSGTC